MLADGRWSTLAAIEDNPERAWTVHDFEPTRVDAIRIVQAPGGGFADHPERLWLTQIELA